MNEWDGFPVDRAASCAPHDHPNLYVCDASVFVSPGGAQPSQMVQALATRLADHLAG